MILLRKITNRKLLAVCAFFVILFIFSSCDINTQMKYRKLSHFTDEQIAAIKSELNMPEDLDIQFTDLIHSYHSVRDTETGLYFEIDKDKWDEFEVYMNKHFCYVSIDKMTQIINWDNDLCTLKSANKTLDGFQTIKVYTSEKNTKVFRCSWYFCDEKLEFSNFARDYGEEVDGLFKSTVKI